MIPAEIVFIEAPAGGAWRAAFVAPRAAVRDTRYIPAARGGEAVRPGWSVTIDERVTATGLTWFEVFTRGGGRGSERRYHFNTLDAAQAWAMTWAGRRFKVEEA